MLADKIKLEPGEEVLIQTRRHWFIPVSHIVALLIIGLIPLLGILSVNSLVVEMFNSNFALSDYAPALFFVYCLILALIWMTIFSVWTNYYLDILIITDRRAILINQKGLFWRNVASFRLERMQDLNTEINGVIATMLDYGTLHVETAGDAEEDFKATYLPHPAEIKSIILQASDNRMNTTPNHEKIAGI